MSKQEYTPKRKWRIECTEEKLRLIANCVEDISRLFAGQPEMMMTVGALDNQIGEEIEKHVLPLIVPDLGAKAYYSWNGGDCPNEWQRKQIAQGFATYKSILHALDTEYDWDSCHGGSVLTCEEGGELMDVRPVDETEPERIDYWTATNPDGKQCTFRSKPLRRQYANGWIWEPSDGGFFYGEEATAALIHVLGLPKLTWEDEPYKFSVLKPKKDGE